MKKLPIAFGKPLTPRCLTNWYCAITPVFSKPATGSYKTGKPPKMSSNKSRQGQAATVSEATNWLNHLKKIGYIEQMMPKGAL